MAKITYKNMLQLLRLQKYEKFLNYDKVIDIGIDTMWKDLCKDIPKDIDATDIFAEEMEELRMTQYSMKLMNICCLCETWEQDLYNFLKERGLIETFSNEYKDTKQIFEREYPSCAISNYPNITEMRMLVNTIKHGEGRSLTNLRRHASDSMFVDSNIRLVDKYGNVIIKKEIEYDGNPLTSQTLNTNGKLQVYKETIIKFWKDVYTLEKDRETTPEL